MHPFRFAGRRRWCRGRGLVALVFSLAAGTAVAATLQVGSKRFTESYILGEIVVRTVRAGGAGEATHQRGLGNTAIVVAALAAGRIDLYPEYTGTIAREILQLDHVPSLDDMNRRLAALGLAASVPLGFDNAYALAMRGDEARRRGIERLSQLRDQSGLRLGLSPEFLGRADGWPGLRRAYDLPQATPQGIDHAIAYEAIAGRQVDVIDVYTTDARIESLDLVVLTDDAGYFPRYDAVLLHRADLPQRLPAQWRALQTLQNRIDLKRMRRMNAAAELEGQDFATIAARFDAGGQAGDATTPSSNDRAGWLSRLFAPDLGRLTAQHLMLVFGSLAASIAIGVPLGILAVRRPAAGGVILGITGLVQTIPALAMLAFLIPLTGRIGALPAFIALSLYALLPIVRNTHTGLMQVPRGISDAARSLGLRPRAVLYSIELPMATPTIVAGVRTSAVIGVGTATIAAFIGAGGFGERIVTGLALNDHTMLVAGALPAAAMALAIEGGFAATQRWWLSPGLRTGVESGARR